MIKEIGEATSLLCHRAEGWKLHYEGCSDGQSITVDSIAPKTQFPPFDHWVVSLVLKSNRFFNAGYKMGSTGPQYIVSSYLKNSDIEIPVHIDFFEYEPPQLMDVTTIDSSSSSFVSSAPYGTCTICVHLDSFDFKDDYQSGLKKVDKNMPIENRFEILDL